MKASVINSSNIDYKKTSFKSMTIFNVASSAFPKGASESVVIDSFTRALHGITRETSHGFLRKVSTKLGMGSLLGRTSVVYKYPGYNHIATIQRKFNVYNLDLIKKQIARWSQATLRKRKDLTINHLIVQDMPEAFALTEPRNGEHRFIVLTGLEKERYDSTQTIAGRRVSKKRAKARTNSVVFDGLETFTPDEAEMLDKDMILVFLKS